MRRLPGASLELIGPAADDAYMRRLTAEIRRLKLDRAVRVRGRVRSVAAIVSEWDLFVSLSSDEGQGLALLEAMALGVPVAARLVAGIEDYFQPDVNGTVVASNRPSDVADAIVRSTTNPRRTAALVRRGRHLTRHRYAWAATVRQIERLYRRALRTTRRER